jgi:exodeoxyribonuclease VII large subunit
VIRAKSEICTQIDHVTRRVRHVVESRVRNYRHELRHLVSSDRLGLLPRRIASRRERLDRSRVTLFRMLEARARSMRARLAAVNAPLLRFPAQVARERERLRSTAATLGAVSPLSVLSRGYAIAFSRTKRGKRKPIMDANVVNVGDGIEVQLKRGAMQCTIDAKTLGIESVWPESRPVGDAPDAQKLSDARLERA